MASEAVFNNERSFLSNDFKVADISVGDIFGTEHRVPTGSTILNMSFSFEQLIKVFMW